MTEPARHELITRLLRQIAPESDPSALKPTDLIRPKLGMDSFDFLRFLIALGEATGVTFPEEDYGKIQTTEGLLSFLEKRLPTG